MIYFQFKANRSGWVAQRTSKPRRLSPDLQRMACSSTAEQPKDERASFVSTAAALSTPELKSAVKALQEILSGREIQSYDLADYGLDKTKIPLKEPSQKYGHFVERMGEYTQTRRRAGYSTSVVESWKSNMRGRRNRFPWGRNLPSVRCSRSSQQFCRRGSGIGKLVK